MCNDFKIGLVLEGGGMRGVFTNGVLDFFMDHDIQFPYCVGVSAGACNGLSYMSRQRGRAKAVTIDLLETNRYIGMKYLWTQRSILDQDLLFKRVPAEVMPFDFEAYSKNPTEFEMVTTNCLTGKACYFTEKQDADRVCLIAKASSSLPFVCPIVWVDHQPMLDGGIVDSIPVERAMEKGYAFNIIVATRNRGYRDKKRDIKMPKYFYRRFPRLRLMLSKLNHIYNRQLDLVEQLEDEGKAIVIRPIRPIEVDRLESDMGKLTALYEEGYACAEKVWNEMSDELKQRIMQQKVDPHAHYTSVKLHTPVAP